MGLFHTAMVLPAALGGGVRGERRLAPLPTATRAVPLPHVAAEGERAPPLVVDLDGTLVSTDLLIESLFALAKTRPLRLLSLPWWLARGRAYAKRRIAAEIMPDTRTLPYNHALLAYLHEEKARGRFLVLATAADESVAHAIALELGLFDAVFASDGSVNLSGERKRDRLIAAFGRSGFDYAGDSSRDRSVWQAARRAILVDPSARLRSAVAETAEIERVFEPAGRGLGVYLRALRVEHWFKNLLVFLPLVVAHRLYDLASLGHALVAFASFSLCASSIYLLNDLVDLPHDRAHPHKKGRMLASGRLSSARAAWLIPVLLCASVALGLTQPPAFVAAGGAYFLLMLAYCLRLRDFLVIDVVTLAAGFVLRVVAGAMAADLAVSPGMLTFWLLFFFGLALLKRYAELVTMRNYDGPQARARAYLAGHSGLVAVVGCASGYLALLALALQTGFGDNPHGRYDLIWIAFILLAYWVTHMWLMARHGRIHRDPLAFALSDPASRIVGVMTLAVMLIAT